VTASIENYVIRKNSWPRFGRLELLWNSVKGWRLAYLCAIIALALEAFFTFASPVIIQLTIDSVLKSSAPAVPFTLKGPAEWLFGKDLAGGGLLSLIAGTGDPSGGWVWRNWLREHLWFVALAFLACVLCQSAFSFLANWLSNLVAENSAKAMRDRLYEHVQELPYETLLRSQSGDWLQRCTSDVDTARQFLCYQLTELCRTVFMVAFAVPVMWSLCPRLTLWGCAALPVIFLYALFFHKAVGKIFLGADERESALSAIIQENVTGVRVVRAFARRDYEMARFNRANDRFRDHIFKLIIILSLFWGVSTVLGLAQIAVVIGFGLVYLGSGTITLGTLLLFITYEQQTVWPVRQFGRVLADVGKTRVALGRMAELLALPVEDDLDGTVADAESWPPAFPRDSADNRVADRLKGERSFIGAADWARGDIEFDHVSFDYPDGTEVLRDVSFRMAGGERLAVLGPTGSGKSTLVHLLLRFYEPTKGVIRIGGRDIRSIPKRELRREIALVLQESFLYGKTIRENIRMGNDEAGDDRLARAARQAAFQHVVEGFSLGWDTMVGERGVTLSGGQRQRLSLARALVRESPILVLDDSLSAVDTETDRHIRNAISADGSAASMIIIAHRLTTLASADRILVLESGRVTALGTHAELMEKPGLYRRLADLQGTEDATASSSDAIASSSDSGVSPVGGVEETALASGI
jgi:ATP-binding cassette subfamily B protein